MTLSTLPLASFVRNRDPLWRCLQAGIDDETLVVFCNTGKEREETLEFVRRCGEEWKIKIWWLEYRRKFLPRYRKSSGNEARQLKVIEASGRAYGPNAPEAGHAIVDFASAARAGDACACTD